MYALPAGVIEYGSSPRVRRTRNVRARGYLQHRFIPACAGNTRDRFCISTTLTVHPRVCGEHVMAGLALCPLFGSSPRVRGTLFCDGHDTGLHRFIPACAGNTCTTWARTVTTPVHPRVCGEHIDRVRDSQGMHGSSPRVRGTPARHGPEQLQRRFIPACAGNTMPALARALILPVHPRVCGEHVTPVPPLENLNGSSPRVRGTPSAAAAAGARWRFIPACAGNTSMALGQTNTIPVHPRVCGEHISEEQRTVELAGSSPRVRGTHGPTIVIPNPLRFIPACAGNTPPHRQTAPSLAVHPRVCGEHHIPGDRAFAPLGSSPRVRGTRQVRRRSFQNHRFIPACAGNTAVHHGATSN